MVDLLQDSGRPGKFIVPLEPVRIRGTVGEMICQQFLPHLLIPI